MNISKAVVIFIQIESDKYTTQEKSQAIYQVMNMPTHNGITKDTILRALRWLFNQQYVVEEPGREENC